jgi:HK97 family phage major capsid protein
MNTPETKEMTLDQLKELINAEVAASGKASAQAVIDEFKKEGLKTEMKKIYPNFGEEGDFSGGTLKSRGGSVIDPTVFRKGLSSGQTDAEFAASLVNIGGPYKKLSPAMEMWGQLLKCTGNRTALIRFPYQDLKTLIQAEYKTYGIKLDGNEMAENDLTSGSYLVPIEFPSMIIEASIKQSPVLQNVWRMPMNGSLVSLPKLTQADGSYFGGVTFQEAGGVTYSGGVIANTGEGVQITPKQANIERLMLLAKKVVAGVILTDEIIQDSVINIINYMTGLLVRAWQYRLEYYIIQGNGTTMPLGITKDADIIASAIPRLALGALSYKDLIKVDGELDEIFSGSEFWLMRKKTLADLRSKVDDVKQPIVRETWGERMGMPTLTPTILSHPYHVTKNVPALGSTGDVIIGNLGMYILGIRSDMRIDISDAPRFEYDETNVRFVARLDGKSGTAFAFKMLKGATS